MKVVLVNPPPVSIQEPMYDTPIFVRPALACLGATLREAGVEVELIDAKFERLSYQQVLTRIEQSRPQVVGLTAFTNEINPAAQVATMAKAKLGDVKTVIGGVHFSALARESMAEFPVFDFGCIGQGDRTIVELCHALERQDSPAEVRGIAWRPQPDEVVINAPSIPPEYGKLPMPAWDLMPAGSRYHLMTARGCPYNCNFCLNPNGRTVMNRTPAQVIEEIEDILKRFAPDDDINIWFDNEIFTIRMKDTQELCDAFLEAGLEKRIGWFAQTHVNVVDQPLFERMKNAGCQRVGMGIESADESVLKSMGKGTTLERCRKACRAAENVGLAVESYFIIGHPNETKASARRSIAFASQINPQIPIFGIMVPYPGTHVAKMAQAGEGGYRLITTDWNAYNKQIGGALEFEYLSRFQLEWLQTTGYLTVFWRNRRFADLARFIWTYRRQGLSVLRKWVTQFFKAVGSPRRTKTPAEPLRPIYSGHYHDDDIVLSVRKGR
jgi:anaerobic magnesium-protoporphyrin IX monomethyl ester cyclase